MYKSSQERVLVIAEEPLNLDCDTTNYWNGTFRFTWLPSYNNPMVITFQRKNQRVTATAKFIELKRPEDYDQVINVRTDSIELELRHWHQFTKSELDAALFWFLPENCIIPKNDGAAWIFEAVTPRKSKTVVVQSPRKDSSFYNLGLFLTNFFEVKELY
jgi:hypothetical protein